MSDKSPAIPLLPEGMDESAENYKRLLPIENEMSLLYHSHSIIASSYTPSVVVYNLK